MSAKTRKAQMGGLTLVEIVVSVFIIIPFLVMSIGVFFKGVQGVTESWEETQAMSSGQILMDTIRRMRWDELTPFGQTVTVYSSLGTDGSESLSNPASFDDVDDWNGYSAPDPLNRRCVRSVRVEFVAVDTGSGQVTPVTGPTDFKRITVTVTGPGDKSMKISTLVANARP